MLERPRIINVKRKQSKCPVCGERVIDIIYGTGDMTKKGINAYDCQLFHSIAANLYAADQSNHLAKVAIIAASILSFVSIVCSIVVAIIS